MSHRVTRKSALTLIMSAALGFGLLSPARDADAGPTAADIMNRVAETRQLAGSEAVVEMSMMNKGQTRVRELSMATKMVGDAEKRIYRFLSPADVKGTGVLVWDYESKADDLWIFLPELRKTRRIVASERSKAFMGSEFSYGDLNTPSLSEFNLNLVKEEDAGGERCFVIDLIPKNEGIAEADGYSKKTYWVSKDKFVVRKGVYFDLDGSPFKELNTSDIKLVDPAKKRYRAMNLEMVNKTNGRKSVFKTKKINFSPNISEDFFTTAYLEKP